MILMYHKVDIITPTIWWVTPDDLDRQIKCLKHREFCYLDEYTTPEDQVVITFDDAHENVYRHALPVLRFHKVPFEVFVVGNLIGEWNSFDPSEPPTRLMSIEHLEEIARQGGRLQWHSRTHPDLSELEDDAVVKEMMIPPELSQRFPAPHFGWFSYPGGTHDPRAIEAARRMFSGAVSVIEGEPEDRWQMNRVTVDRDTSFTVHRLRNKGPGHS